MGVRFPLLLQDGRLINMVLKLVANQIEGKTLGFDSSFFLRNNICENGARVAHQPHKLEIIGINYLSRYKMLV